MRAVHRLPLWARENRERLGAKRKETPRGLLIRPGPWALELAPSGGPRRLTYAFRERDALSVHFIPAPLLRALRSRRESASDEDSCGDVLTDGGETAGPNRELQQV